MSKPAIALYRSILKEHRTRLPSKMRSLGDVYVRNEFKLHKTAKPEHLKLFFAEWNKYLEHIRNDRATFGRDIEDSGYTLTEEQAKQLNSLKEEVRGRSQNNR